MIHAKIVMLTFQWGYLVLQERRGALSERTEKGEGSCWLAAAGLCAPPLAHGSQWSMPRGCAVSFFEVRRDLVRVTRVARIGRPGGPRGSRRPGHAHLRWRSDRSDPCLVAVLCLLLRCIVGHTGCAYWPAGVR